MQTDEFSESGSPIYRYDNMEAGEFQPVSGDMDNIDAISDHLEKYIGPIDMVFHELVSDKVHLDIHWVKPTEKFPFNTLITSGMSDLPMNAPEGADDDKYSELFVMLPADWNISEEGFNDERNYWPVRWLKTIARLPHDYNSWVSYGHTIPNGENADGFAENTKLGCMMLLPSFTFDKNFFTLEINQEKTIKFYGLTPLYKEEMDYKLKKGSEKLEKQLDKYNISEIIDINRKNTCLKTGLLGLW